MPRDQIFSPEHDRNRSLGWLAIRWMEHFTVHGPGDVQGDPVDLDDELAEFTADCYAVGANGRRLYDSAFLSRPKGRDKSGHAGRFVLFEAFGPCRFAGWAAGGEVYQWQDFEHEYMPGDPMGRRVVTPFIRCLATEATQAGNTYDNVYFNLTEGPLSEGLPTNAAGLTRTFLPGGGEIVPSTSGNASKDGGKETFSVFDETHLYVRAELRAMYATVRRNMAKRKRAEPWSLETSTMYMPGEDSVAEDTHALAKMIRSGQTKSSRLLFDHREWPADVDLGDEGSLRAALRDVYGPFAEVMDLDRIIAEIWDPRNSVQDSRRFFGNEATNAADSWIAGHEWAARKSETEVKPGEAITLGFDGSRSRTRGISDATALIGCRVADGHLFEIEVWEQPRGPAGDGWQVPTIEVEAAVADSFKRYSVVGFFADPAKWESYIAAWEAKWGSRLRVKSTVQHPIEWWMVGGRSLAVVRALEQFHSAVIDGDMTHGNGKFLTSHVLNARRRPSKSGIQIAKEHPDSEKKIDAAVAAVLAFEARTLAVAMGAGRQMAVPRRIR